MKQNILKLMAVFLVVLFALSIFPAGIAAAEWDGTTKATSYESGDGTEANPFIIKNGPQLAYLAEQANADAKNTEGKFFKLAADINLGGKEWTPIGTGDNRFEGNFDGNNHTVSNFVITSSTTSDKRLGLFGVTRMAEIKNLKIDHVTITTPTDGYAGALAGYLTGGTVSNCHAYENVAINGTTGSIGGIAGRLANGIAEYCTSAATVSGNGAKNVFAGGIIGCAGVSATVRFCVNTGPVTSTRTEGEAKTLYTGGIVGLTGAGSEPASIINCYNIGSITGIAATGGITGRIHVDGAVVENCYNLGSISGEDNYSGGIVGWINKTATFANCFAKEQGSLPLFGNNDASVDVTGLVAKTESEIKALTDAIDAAIDELNKTPAEETTATTTASSTTSSDSSTSPTTFDQAYILILLASISIIVCFMFKKSSKKAV